MSAVLVMLLFGLFVIVGPILATRLPPPGAKAQLEKSFKAQAIDVDGTRYAGSDLKILYRKNVYYRSQSYAPRSFQLDAEWILRAPNGSYVLGIAQGDPEEREFGIRWVWRHLTEERARHALQHDTKAYRLAFGESLPDEERAVK